MGIYDHSSRSAFVWSHTDVGHPRDVPTKLGGMKLSNISWYAEAFRVPFTGTKGPSPAPETPPNFTLGTMQ